LGADPTVSPAAYPTVLIRQSTLLPARLIISAQVLLLAVNIALAASSNGIRDFATIMVPSDDVALNCPGRLLSAIASTITLMRPPVGVLLGAARSRDGRDD
jgi:hypothetical protein